MLSEYRSVKSVVVAWPPGSVTVTPLPSTSYCCVVTRKVVPLTHLLIDVAFPRAPERIVHSKGVGRIGTAHKSELRKPAGGDGPDARLLSRTDAIQPEHSLTYGYDSLYRLSQAISQDASWEIDWAFDVWGNRTTQTPHGLAASKVGTATSGYYNNRNTANPYDAAGNQTNDGIHSYTFSAENQILSMDGGAATYAYDLNPA